MGPLDIAARLHHLPPPPTPMSCTKSASLVNIITTSKDLDVEKLCHLLNRLTSAVLVTLKSRAIVAVSWEFRTRRGGNLPCRHNVSHDYHIDSCCVRTLTRSRVLEAPKALVMPL